MSEQQQATRRRVRQVGTVASVAGEKSVVVRVDRRVMHPRYHKYVGRSRKLMAHDERTECGIGDLVEVVQCRPLSARKRWRIVKVIRKAAGASQAEV